MNKKILFPAMALGILGVGILGANSASAGNFGSNHDEMVSKIASKFGLKEEDVQKVFDEARQERMTEMQKKHEERLATLVSEGKITETQKNLILAKHKEMQDERTKNIETWKNLTPEERKTQMENRKTEMQNWAKENGIDPEYLINGFGPGKNGRGPRN